MLKQIEPKTVTLCDVDFAIYPFGAMKAANMSGELGKFFGPLVAGLAPVILGDTEGENDVLSMDLNDAMPLVTGAFSTLDGDVVEKLFRKLLLGGHISYRYRDNETGKEVIDKLNSDSLDEIFCQNVDDMYRLAYEVIKLNYKGFFKKLLGQSGNLQEKVKSMMSGSMESLTEVNFQSSN